MSKSLPTGDFKFISRRNTDKTFNELTSNTYLPGERVRKVCQVDIDYWSSFHDYNNDDPFLHAHHDDELTPSLYKIRYYVLNDDNLIQALKHRLRLVRIHIFLSYG